MEYIVNYPLHMVCPLDDSSKTVPETCTKNCMYNTGQCMHPAISGLTDDQLLEHKAASLGLTTAKHETDQASQRIKYALWLDAYADFIKSNRQYVIEPTDASSELLRKCLSKSLLAGLLLLLELSEKQLLAMCSKTAWDKFCKVRKLGNVTFDEVAGIRTSTLIALRATLADKH